jgi:Flp pilus assembly protein TadB
MRRSHDDQPTLITTARESGDEEFDHRRKRYAIMMALRGLFVVLAAITYHASLWLALSFIVAGAVLPWCAVILANDGPPKKRARHIGSVAPDTQPALPAGKDDRTVDG